MFGSSTTVLGALPNNCGGGDRKLDGFTFDGGGMVFGKPWDNRTFGTDAQPGVGVPTAGDVHV